MFPCGDQVAHAPQRPTSRHISPLQTSPSSHLTLQYDSTFNISLYTGMAVHRIHVIQSKVRRFLQRIAINLCLWSKVQTCWISWTGKGHKHNRCLNPNGRDCHFCCCPGHSRVLFGLVQKYEEKEESNVIMWTNLERLDMAHIKLEAALRDMRKVANHWRLLVALAQEAEVCCSRMRWVVLMLFRC